MAKISENIEGWFDRNSDGRGFRAQLTDEQRQTIRDQVKEIQSQGASWKKIRPTIKKLLEDWGIELPENRPEQGDPATSKDQESIESGEQELIKASNYPNPFNPEARTIPLLGMALKVRIFSTQPIFNGIVSKIGKNN